jgi:uncharacterized membrane protein (DUF485 family)
MCFSLEASLGTFVFSWGASIYLLTKQLTASQRNNVIFLMIFSTMQLADAALWWNGMKKNALNYYVTSLAIPLILAAQLLFNAFIRNGGQVAWLNALALLGSFYGFVKLNGYSTSVCDGLLSSPIWASRELKYWEMVLFLIGIWYPGIPGIMLTAFVFFPLLYAFAKGGYGSLWCAAANGLALVYLLDY